MKNTMKSALSLVLMFMLVFSFAACGKAEEQGDLWAQALYTEDTTLGEGAKTLTVEVAVGEKTVTFTVKTDETTVGAALLAHELIAGEVAEYGLYIKRVNGILADFDIDQSYWAFYIDGEYAMTGADLTEIAEGSVYRFEYAK